MKITRLKKVQRFMAFFRNSYGFRQPYQVLIDGTFCVAAKKNKVNIQDQIPKYLGSAKLLTTQCAIIETEKLGKELYGALVIIKQFKHHKCGHEGKPVPASECLQEMLGATNPNRYIIASQDYELQKIASRIPGVPLLYWHDQAPTLKPPSGTSTRMANLNSQARFEVSSYEKEILIENKKQLGIAEETCPEKKKKKRKEPNSLSCKRKKKQPMTQNPHQVEPGEGGVKKRRRKRIKIAKHVKEHFSQNSLHINIGSV